MSFYFAYGSNMDERQMALRCPLARLVGLATLPGHLFFVTAGGWASVRPDNEAQVWGLLWEITPSDEEALDVWEDVAAGLYAKESRAVAPTTGASRDALVYVARESREGTPSSWYIDLILDAAARHRLPDAYQSILRAWRH